MGFLGFFPQPSSHTPGEKAVGRMLLTPFDVPSKFAIVQAETAKAARRWMSKRYIPIECSFGGESVVDALMMDHHGPYSHLESVAIRAYRDHFGAARENPKFVVTGFPDEDATFAIAALAGILPHPSNADRFPDAPPSLRKLSRQNYQHVAELISAADTNPDEALGLVDSHFGRMVLAWRMETHPTCRDILQWYGGVNRWRDLLTTQEDEFIDAAGEAQEARLQHVLGAPAERFDEVAVVDFSTFGPNSSYYRRWLDEIPVLVAHLGGPYGTGPCSFAARNLATAEKLFGKDGLRAIYHRLDPGGCGGREIIGGSSRTIGVTWKQAIEYGKQLTALRI